MAVKIVYGNLLNAEEIVIGHQVNCQGIMESRIAKQIREAYPKAYNEYIQYCSSYSNKKDLLGRCCRVYDNGKVIAHLFGQFNYGHENKQYTNYGALANALVSLKINAQAKKLSVALPYKIGCGLGNGEWKVVLEKIENIFNDYDVTLYKYSD